LEHILSRVWFGRLDSDEEPDDFWGFDEEHKKKGKKHAISKNWLSSKNKLMETTSVRLPFFFISTTLLGLCSRIECG
jgi:hypothetical protein